MNPVIRLDPESIEPEIDYPRPERLLKGNPKRTTWLHYQNPTGEVFAGVWSCEVGAWRIEMGEREDEHFFVTAGACVLTGDDGTAVTCKAGESLVIPAGFKGVFEVTEAMTKHFMIVERGN